jgi:hypothetical protein
VSPYPSREAKFSFMDTTFVGPCPRRKNVMPKT